MPNRRRSTRLARQVGYLALGVAAASWTALVAEASRAGYRGAPLRGDSILPVPLQVEQLPVDAQPLQATECMAGDYMPAKSHANGKWRFLAMRQVAASRSVR